MIERDYRKGMSVAEVNAWVDDVRKHIEVHDDNESAHACEDALLVAVLQAIAGDDTGLALNPEELARAALGVLDIEYTRWHS
jgi:hypothetical protein